MSEAITINNGQPVRRGHTSSSSNCSPLELPPELWSLIVTEVGAADRASLRTLLRVSRLLSGLATPLFYEHIRRKMDGKQYRQILSSLSSSPHLHHTIKFELTIVLAPFHSTLLDILSGMKKLERLSLQLILAAPSSLTTVLPALTHFIYVGAISAETLSAFLASVPRLQYLDLSGSIYGFKVPANALRNLKTFIGPPEIHEHRWYSHRFGDLHTHVRSLRIETSIRPVVVFLEAIEYLSIVSEGFECGSILSLLTSIPSPKLRYISIGAPRIETLDRVKGMFQRFPKLEAIDYRDDPESPYHARRYLRDQEDGNVVFIASPKTWEHWWVKFDTP
ncbi:hypothetical protein ONZ45_g9245 [Pleurotus djamor]|nr:hypothetical protein ONZ45_g9245 [Pleurotus djamor]